MVLLINPPIHDFTAYDLWIRPLGLLYVAAVLRENGHSVRLIDALDRHHPDVLKRQGRTQPKSRLFGDGFFFKEEIQKPVPFRGIRRRFSRYGMPPDLLEQQIAAAAGGDPIDAVLITSGMTFWYPGVMEAIRIAKRVLPSVPVILGGIYATLFPEHARKSSGADHVVRGEGELTALELLSGMTGRSPRRTYKSFNDFPFPAYDLYPHLDAVAMMTTRGCPYACSFCATHAFTPHYKQREPGSVVDEIAYYATNLGVKNITFYDDALFVKSASHIKPILRQVIHQTSGVNFHTPNGLFAKLLDAELAELMVAAGFKTVRLSYESKNPERQKQMRKVTDRDLETALENLSAAGFPVDEVTVYLLAGLPGQPPQEVAESIDYVHRLGARISLSSFSPIPGTPDWDRSVEDYGFQQDEPLLTNKSIYPLRNPGFSEKDFDELTKMVKSANDALFPSDRGDSVGVKPVLHGRDSSRPNR